MNQLPKEIQLKGKNSNHIFKALKPPIRALLPEKGFMYITTYFTKPDVYNMDAVKFYTSEMEMLADIQKNSQQVFFYKKVTSEEDANSIRVDLILGNPKHDIATKKFK